MKMKALYMIVVVLVWVLMSGSSRALISVLPPPKHITQQYTTHFGCGIATEDFQPFSQNSHVAVYAAASPYIQGTSPWQIYIYKNENNSWTNTESIYISEGSSTLPASGQPVVCALDYVETAGWIMVGEPWYNNAAGRVVVSHKIGANQWASPVPVETPAATLAGDALGSTIQLGNEWGFASAVLASIPYVNVYQENAQTWIFKSRITPPEGETGQFGSAIASDSSWLAIGSPNPGLNQIGRVFLYKYDVNTQTWVYKHFLRGKTDKCHFFGSSLTLKNNHLLVGSKGSRAAAGHAYLYSIQPGSDEWSLVKMIQSPVPTAGDDFGTTVAGTDNIWAVADSPLNSPPSVHVYTDCGVHAMALHHLVNAGGRQEAHFGKSMSWASDHDLIIGATGAAHDWNPSLPKACSGSLGPFPSSDCCDSGTYVIARSLSLLSADLAAGALNSPLHITGNLTLGGGNVLLMSRESSIQVDGILTLAGKLKLVLPYQKYATPVQDNFDRVLTYNTRVSKFNEIEVVFDKPRTKCDRITVQPVYASYGLNLMLHITTPNDCSNGGGDPLVAVYITLGILLLLIVAGGIAIWKVPKLRDMLLSSPARARPRVHYSALNADEDDVGSNAFASYKDQDTSLGAEIDRSYQNTEDEDEASDNDLDAAIPEQKIPFV